MSWQGRNVEALEQLSEYGHHSIDHLDERRVEEGNSQHSTLTGLKGSVLTFLHSLSLLRRERGDGGEGGGGGKKVRERERQSQRTEEIYKDRQTD